MVNSLRYVLKSVLISLFIVLCSSAFLTAQETKSKFTQRLNWKSDFKAMEYLVEVKNENSDEIIEALVKRKPHLNNSEANKAAYNLIASY